MTAFLDVADRALDPTTWPAWAYLATVALYALAAIPLIRWERRVNAAPPANDDRI